MSLEDIRKLFEKLELFPTLDSISILLPYTDDNPITSVFNSVVREIYKSCTSEFEGMNEYDYICLVSNFDISEFKRKIDLFSQKELMFVQSIINNALNGIKENELTNRIIPILEEYKEIGTSEFVEETKIENFFNKFDINELYTLNIILDNNCDQSVKKYKEIFNKVLKEKENKPNVRSQEYSLLNLLNKTDDLNNQELNLLYELVENASLYLSSVQDYSYAYKDVIEDFNINEYPVIAIYKLEEELSKKLESMKDKNQNKRLIYKK